MSKKPDITISSLDAERLELLLEALKPDATGRAELEAELARASVVEPQQMPANVVTMNSTVKFVMQSSGEAFEMTLVYPKDADSSGKTVSILAPVGSALLGLTQGDEIEWPNPAGGMTTIQVTEVTYQPERDGALHR
ncbi:MAG: nucleoside diphosphate kinase regulator [Cellvibrionales bacterium]|jgi:regulator of nucleoside diphosphate kinase|nr:nucleoside diphosphate kinase regulator [Cellvibrionales bacterium]MBK8676799.1 nucleoside diphosphate kinase regulator [Cellvibrionales bacterium]HRF87363.1 nucleoside diphosphate kinase regulator [Pseudomonadales bacterium]HRG50557.1 nucleoside diphosphate kinase regulator [Pseudomonadales bacterium]